jgi:actin related protein 2/3 complex subunit 2
LAPNGRSNSIPQAPSVSFFYDPPTDLNKVSGFKPGKKETLVGYVQFQIFKSHVDAGKMEKTIALFTMFRGYLMYHIKASKSHLHSRMRARCTNLLQVLKRADPKEEEAAGRKNFRTYNN